MSSSEKTKYLEVQPFDIGDGKTFKMEPVQKSKQFIAAIVANFACVAVGTTLGWTSPVMPKLLEGGNVSPLSEKIQKNSPEEAWISSLVAVGALIAPFIAGPLTDKIGRKWTNLSSTVLFVLAYVLLLIGSEVWIIYLARLIQGFGVGIVMTVVPMYVGEISTDDCRGATGSLMQLFIVAGILFSYAVGPFVSYSALQWACLVIPIAFAVCFFFMPESPYYYAGKGKKFDAVNSLKWLRGQSTEGVQDEMNEIQASVEEAQRSKGSVADIIKNKGNLKALIICAGLIAFQQLSGINVVLFNSQSIFDDAKAGLDSAIATILVGVVQVLASGVTPFVVDRLGRKIMLLVSAVGMCIGLVSLGAFFAIKASGADISNIGWLPVTSLIVYIIVYCIGFGPLPWAVLGEMFPGNVKSVASSMVASTCWILGFVITRWYPDMNNLGPQYAFFLFGGFCVAAFFFTLFVVMETKGLSLQQIQDKLNGK